MGPFGIPWSSFASVGAVVLAILIALGWAAWDRWRERKDERR